MHIILEFEFIDSLCVSRHSCKNKEFYKQPVGGGEEYLKSIFYLYH